MVVDQIRSVVALTLLATTMPQLASADATVTLLHSFDGADGRHPNNESRLALGPFGTVFGVTMSGGSSDEGALFMLNRADRFQLVHSFVSGQGRPWMPNAVTFSSKGVLVGTTSFGGEYDCGTLFTLGLFDRVQTLHSFNCTDGNQPTGKFEVTDEAVFGSTGRGGEFGAGNVYRLSASKVKTLYSVPNLFSNDAGTYWGIERAAGGTVFTATYGYDVGDFHGSVLKVEKNGASTVLHTFTGQADGSRPTSPPIALPDGTLYGTTSAGGAHGVGTIYKISPSSEYSIVYSFGADDMAATPWGELTLGKNGRIYGTTASDNVAGRGSIFEFDPNGGLRVLHYFNDEFFDPKTGLLEKTPGTFYGMTGSGGEHSYGGIFKLQVNE
jgi:uncharacterized repeat protein (TIGR03803 family)